MAFYLLNTNYGNEPADDADMLAHEKAAAFFEPWKRKIERLERDDVVFLYRSGQGLVAFGWASGELDVGDYHGDPRAPGEEFSMRLDPFVRLPSPLTAREMKLAAARNISFQQTMVMLDEPTGRRLLDAATACAGELRAR
jgi:hypothetical protein